MISGKISAKAVLVLVLIWLGLQGCLCNLNRYSYHANHPGDRGSVKVKREVTPTMGTGMEAPEVLSNDGMGRYPEEAGRFWKASERHVSAEPLRNGVPDAGRPIDKSERRN